MFPNVHELNKQTRGINFIKELLCMIMMAITGYLGYQAYLNQDPVMALIAYWNVINVIYLKLNGPQFKSDSMPSFVASIVFAINPVLMHQRYKKYRALIDEVVNDQFWCDHVCIDKDASRKALSNYSLNTIQEMLLDLQRIQTRKSHDNIRKQIERDLELLKGADHD